MDNNGYILFIDSGIGGLSVLKYFITQNPNTRIIYYADTINFPYGLKKETAIGKILYNIYNNLSGLYNISLIAIVCNTASVSALNYLRERVNIPIVGTVPAIKPASKFTKNNKIGIIATNTTIKSGYLNNLINQFAQDKMVYIKPGRRLVEAAENLYKGKKLKNVIIKELKELKKSQIDVLVLGCTHYSFFKDEISNYFNNSVKIIDSIEGVSNRIVELMPENVRFNKNFILFVSSAKKSIIEKYKKINDEFTIFNEIIIKDMSCQKD